MTTSSFADELQRAIPGGLLSSDEFIDLVFKPARGERWRKVTVRPVMVKGRRLLQFS